MDAAVERMSLELRDELASNDRRQVDPCSVPVRFSALKHFARSPAHGRHAMIGDDNDETLARRLGSGGHALILGGAPVVVYPGKVRRGKEWDAFLAAHTGSVILNEREHKQATALADAVRRNKVAERLLLSAGTVHENRIDWEWMGRRCRSTPDARNGRVLVELKSTRDAAPWRFTRDAERLGYHAQLAFYRRAIHHATGSAPDQVFIVAVEQQAPHAVTVFQLTDSAIEQGDKLCRLWFEQLLTCEAAREWPEYSQAIEMMDFADPDEAFRIEIEGEDFEF